MLASLSLSLIVAVAVLLTSAISGVFGMAGGMILMLIFGTILKVETAMVLHGVTQFVSNGWRAVLWRKWIDWKIIGLYLLGALPALAVPIAVTYVPDKPTMLILLGMVPYIAFTIPARWALDASKPRHAVACGFSVTGMQLLAGVAGPLLDIFFVQSKMDRRVVVATKATSQAISHTLKVAYYGMLIAAAPGLGNEIYATAAIAALIGTTLAGPILERISNESFRRWTRVIVLIVGGLSMTQGFWLLATA